MVELFDDKRYVNDVLRAHGSFTVPRGWVLTEPEGPRDLEAQLNALRLPYPIVGKPIRGRGSYGVKVCDSMQELHEHVNTLFKDSPMIMLEEYLKGEESTVTVMPPSSDKSDYWAMPIVTRFNHEKGIAPYNGVVAVTSNSRVVTPDEYAQDPAYATVARECEAAARLLRLTAPIRIDVRRYDDKPGSKFALFDVNMKPVCQYPNLFPTEIPIANPPQEHDRPRATRAYEPSEFNGNSCGSAGLGLPAPAAGDAEQLFHAEASPTRQACTILREEQS